MMIGIGPGIMRRKALIAQRIFVEDDPRLLEIADQLGLDAQEARLLGLIHRRVPIGRLLEIGAQREQAILGHGVIDREGIDLGVTGGEAIFLALQLLEEADHALARIMRIIQMADGGRVGGTLDRAAEREELALGGTLPRHHRRHAGLARARGDRGGAEQQREQGDARRGLGRILRGQRRAAGLDMAELVGDDALDLVGIVGMFDRAAIEEDRLTNGNEGVDLRIVDHPDLDGIWGKTGRDRHRRGDVGQELLGFGVTQHRLGQCGLGGECQRHERHSGDSQRTETARHYPLPCPARAEPRLKD